MHAADSHRKQEDSDVDPSEKVTTAVLPGDSSTPTGTSPNLSVFGGVLPAL